MFYDVNNVYYYDITEKTLVYSKDTCLIEIFLENSQKTHLKICSQDPIWNYILEYFLTYCGSGKKFL